MSRLGGRADGPTSGAGPRRRRARAGAPWWSGVLLAGVLAFHALVAWVPFEPDPPARLDNAASLQGDTLRIDGRRAVARSVEGLPGVGPETRHLEVELTAEPASADPHGPARILSIAASDRVANLMIGQEHGDLIVRVRGPDTTRQGRPALVVDDAFGPGNPTAIRVRVTPERATVAVDGRVAVSEERGPEALAAWDPGQGLWLGDGPGVPRPWQGRLTDVALTVDGERVDYLDPAVLDVPARVWYVPERVVGLARIPDAAARARSLLHLVGFVPVGALLAVVLGRRAALARVGVLALAASVVLQLGKTSIAGRHPSLLDVGAHLLGALLGSWLVLRHRARAARHRPQTAALEES